MQTISKNTKIGFIGIGVMGKSMSRNLLKAGYPVHIFTRTKEKALELVDEGAAWFDTTKDLAANCDVIMTMVGYPSDVEEVYEGIFENAKEGTILIDFTTSTPTLAKEIYQKAKEKKMYSLDAPVSGGDIGAREAKLAIMVGGDEEVFQAVLPLFEVLGANIILQGGAGSGQHTKMVNQIAIASKMLGVCEALIYAKKAGLDLDNVLKSISTGAAGSWTLSNLAPRIVKGDFEPGFYIKHFIKDMRIAIHEAHAMGLELLGLQLAEELYSVLAEEGLGDKGTQALYKYYETRY